MSIIDSPNKAPESRLELYKALPNEAYPSVSGLEEEYQLLVNIDKERVRMYHKFKGGHECVLACATDPTRYCPELDG